jgi:glycolate oxidase iron-sulfur subunit
MDSMQDDLPVVVNSAGCGSTMKEYGSLVDGDRSRAFAKRVVDISEFLVAEGLVDLLRNTRLDVRATYHDACHLAHGQRVRSAPRSLMAAVPGLDYVELVEADTCCGSAGIYNVTQPDLARALLERKWSNVQSTGATVLATGNPGCHAWIAQAASEHGKTVAVLHTAELLEAAFTGLEAFLER